MTNELHLSLPVIAWFAAHRSPGWRRILPAFPELDRVSVPNSLIRTYL